MRRVHAFGDDALGELRRGRPHRGHPSRLGRQSRGRSTPPSPAPKPSTRPEWLGVQGFRASARATADPADRRSSAGVPRSSRTTSTSRHADHAGHRRVGAAGCGRRRRVHPAVPGHRADSLGKTQMSEFGFSAAAEHPRLGPVRNPWNTDYTAGASSSGSAAFVAAGVVPIAHANDGGGSIRIPAVLQRARRAEAVARPVAAGPELRADAGAASSPTAC